MTHHLEVKFNQTQKGLSWAVFQKAWDAPTKKYKYAKLTPLAFTDLGFSDKMTLKQARDHAKKLNKLNALERKEQQSQVKAAERLTDLITIENSIIPEDLSSLFIDHIKENWYGGD